MMIEIDISDEILEKSKDRLDRIDIEQRDLNLFGSERDRILIGYIGELMVMEFLGIKFLDDTHNYDMRHGRHRLEVKSINCKFKPLDHFLATVNSSDLNGFHEQDADFYIFTRILNDKTRGWVVGFIGCKDFCEIATFVKKGTTVAGIKFSKANAKVILISQLTSLDNWHEKRRV